MKSNKFTHLKLKIKSLAVFRELLKDRVISALLEYFEMLEGGDLSHIVSAYSDFLSCLYEENGGCLSEHIKSILLSSENVYVKRIGGKQKCSLEMLESVKNEISVLQEVCDLDSNELCSAINWSGELPKFSHKKFELKKSFDKRAKNIKKFGYGLYAKNKMFYIDDFNRIIPVKNPDEIQLDELVGYNEQRQIIIDNTKALLSGKPALNILLTGDAGTGKSSTVKAVANALYNQGLRIIEIRKNQLSAIPMVLDELAQNPLKFILFIDDLSFLKDDDNFNALKAVLEGSVSAKSKNVVIYATSNRRHIIKEKFSDREGDEVHIRDTLEEHVSLSERFGIHVTFSKPDKKSFLNIVTNIAEKNCLRLDENDLLLAERFALERGGRSARIAKQFVQRMLSKS